jgi:hypothetical protein
MRNKCSDYATKHSPDAQRPRLSTRSVSFRDKRRTSVRAPRLLGLDVGAIGRAEAHSADGYRLVDVSVCRPAPGHFEVAQLTYQAGHQHAERAALGDRIPPATLADAPPEAAPARGDLSWPAHSEPAPAVLAPHGKARCAGRQAFNRLIKPTHRKACGYPAWTLSCFRFEYFWAYPSSALSEDPPTGFLVGARGRATKWEGSPPTAGDASGRRRTALPRSDMPQPW